jgi:hypothetical protein
MCALVLISFFFFLQYYKEDSIAVSTTEWVTCLLQSADSQSCGAHPSVRPDWPLFTLMVAVRYSPTPVVRALLLDVSTRPISSTAEGVIAFLVYGVRKEIYSDWLDLCSHGKVGSYNRRSSAVSAGHGQISTATPNGGNTPQASKLASPGRKASSHKVTPADDGHGTKRPSMPASPGRVASPVASVRGSTHLSPVASPRAPSGPSKVEVQMSPTASNTAAVAPTPRSQGFM